MKNKTVIYIDDEPALTDLLSIALENENLNVITFNNPLKALEYLKSNKCDILITDMRMPELSGLDLLKKIQKYDVYSYGIIFSAYITDSLKKEILKLKLVNNIIEKKFSLPMLVDIILEYLKQ